MKTLSSGQGTCKNLEQEMETEIKSSRLRSQGKSQFEILVLKLVHSSHTWILGNLGQTPSKSQMQKSPKTLTFTWGCFRGLVEVQLSTEGGLQHRDNLLRLGEVVFHFSFLLFWEMFVRTIDGHSSGKENFVATCNEYLPRIGGSH